MRVNLVGYKYKNLGKDWSIMYNNVIQSLRELNLDIRISPFLNVDNKPKDIKVGIDDNKEDIYIYNHSFPEEIEKGGFFNGVKSIFLKPTGPTNKHYSIDPLGYSSRVTITYDKPKFENINYKSYWDNEIFKIKKLRSHKWGEKYKFKEYNTHIPDDHILFIGQMPGDTSVNEFSFNHHIEDIEKIIDNLDSKDPVVIKLHPFLKREAKPKYWSYITKKIIYWRNMGHTVIDDFIDIQLILPKTKLAVLENSTAGIECMMYDIPMITFGCPEYRWVSKELRHLVNINQYKNDLSWFNKELSRKFLVWYTRDWLCYDKTSTTKRLKQILNL